MEYILQTLLNGILAGCIYALFAMGLTLIYGVLNFVNFAHGELIMWGAFFLFLRNAAQFFWGAEVRTFGTEVVRGLRILGLSITPHQIAIIVVSVLCVL